MKRSLLATTALIAFPSIALAQSNPGLTFGQIPTAGQWNGYFSSKQDYIGSVAFSSNGGVISGNLTVTGQSLFSSTSTPTALCSGTVTNNQTIAGTNQSGILTVGATATSVCTVTFSPATGTAFSSCVISPANLTAATAGGLISAFAGAPTTTSFSLQSGSAALQSRAYAYQCF
jgi:hypothetical protein